jgi:hypothetical protein
MKIPDADTFSDVEIDMSGCLELVCEKAENDGSN